MEKSRKTTKKIKLKKVGNPKIRKSEKVENEKKKK